jgi:hypothetical protein
MRRELPRTLYTLSPEYQRQITASDYEILLVDNNSDAPISSLSLASYGANVNHISFPGSRSPAAAINYAVRQCSGDYVMICIDGARMLSPGLLSLSIQALQARPNSVVATLAWHLGLKPQTLSVDEGYNQSVEDQLLESVNWQKDGYELFRISSFAISSNTGWFMPISESNCVCMARCTYDLLNGFDERFQCAGGGLVNLDFYKRSCGLHNDIVVLLGEGTFHQFHGGVSTNISSKDSPFEEFHQEYIRLRGESFSRPIIQPIYFGTLPSQCLPFLTQSLAFCQT